jgi:ribosomal protein S12 methylthiotransferase
MLLKVLKLNSGGKSLEKKCLIYFESLGCDKNLVDSEVMLGMLNQEGFTLTMNAEDADAIIINTCSFIHDAKEESINTIIEYAGLKEGGQLKALIVVGCLTELYKEEVMKEIPEIDAILGAANYDRILEAVSEALAGHKYIRFDSIDNNPEVFINRTTETTKHYGYLKIAEGCDNNCTYCIIPKLRGKFRSRKMESLIEEVRFLVDQGKTEIILVAQDVGKYGTDIYNKKALPELIQKIAEVEGVHWIRLLYVYPEDVTEELISLMKDDPKLLHYIDMPLQHVDDTILKRMARKSRQESIRNLILRLREQVPDICIRTTFIVGFPGETEEAFQELYRFVDVMKLDRVGVFTYSREEGTPAYTMDNQIDASLSMKRKDQIMLLQQNISTEKNRSMIGRTIEVMVDGYVPKDDIYIGRSYKDTPDVDGYVFLESDETLLSGDFVTVKIVQANEYDLIGEII